MILMAEIDNPRRKSRSLSLTELRVTYSFYSQRELAEAVPMAESIVWRAENHLPISLASAVKIIRTLENRGLKVEHIEDMLDAIDWEIKWPRQPKKKGQS